MKKIIGSVILITLIWVSSVRPAPLMIPIKYQSQDAIDAVQNVRLSAVESMTEMHSSLLTQLQADRNWLMGGIAMVGGLFVIVQLLQVVQLRKKL